MSGVARRIKVDVGSGSVPKDTLTLTTYGNKKSKLKDCNLGDEVVLSVCGKLTRMSVDEFSQVYSLEVEKISKEEGEEDGE